MEVTLRKHQEIFLEGELFCGACSPEQTHRTGFLCPRSTQEGQLLASTIEHNQESEKRASPCILRPFLPSNFLIYSFASYISSSLGKCPAQLEILFAYNTHISVTSSLFRMPNYVATTINSPFLTYTVQGFYPIKSFKNFPTSRNHRTVPRKFLR